MNLHKAMNVFVAVAEQNGFAPAARILELSTTSVSRHVAELESSLGVQLLRRSTRNVNLTEAGEHYLAGAKKSLDHIRELHSEMASLNETPRGKLRITAISGFGSQFFGPLISQFAGTYPTLSIEVEFTSRLSDLILEGYDVGIRAGNLRDSTLMTRKIMDFHYVTCASPEYLAAHGTPQHPQDLTAHDCVYWRCAEGPTTWKFYEDQELIEVPITGRFRINNAAADLAGARASLGVAMLPPGQVIEDFRTGRLVPILQKFPVAPELVSLVWPPSAAMPRKLRVFVDFIVENVVAAEF